MDEFLETSNLLKLNQGERESLKKDQQQMKLHQKLKTAQKRKSQDQIAS